MRLPSGLNVQNALLIGLSLLPAILLIIFIYKMDRTEKEPKGLLVGLFFIGVGTIIPVLIVEILMTMVLNGAFFGEFGYYEPEYFDSYAQLYAYEGFDNFFCVALVEEFFKWLFLFIMTHKNKHFNCLFDGVVYAVFVSLGFASVENIVYVFGNGITTALLRMVTAVPAHCVFGVIMGYFYSMWSVRNKAGALEKHLTSAGVISLTGKPIKFGGMLALSIIVPALGHGFYDFIASIDSWVCLVIFILFMGFLYFLCFRNVYKLSKADKYSSFISMDMVLKKYPSAAKYVSTIPEYSVYFYP